MTATPSRLVPITRPHLPELPDFNAIVEELFTTRMLSNFSKYSRLLEDRAATVLDHPAPLCVANCDIGLTLAWKALECSPGEVIVPSFTFCSTVNALHWNGLEPVFADVDPDTYCMDVDDVRRLITPRTVGIAAVHVFGVPAAIKPLQELVSEHGLRLLFDAAHGLGGRHEGLALGAFGDASVFSLSGTKLVTGGEGGLATFRDPEAAERFSYLRAYGFKADYNCRHIGLNGKLSELNAALAWLSLDLLDDAASRRQSQVERYRRALEPYADLGWQAVPAGCVHGYKDLAIKFPSALHRAAAESSLGAAGIMTKRYFFPVHRMEAYRQHALRRLPVTDDLYDRLLCIPIYHDLEDEQIESICRSLIDSMHKVASGRYAA